jgi:nucleoside-diphosphate-sugar epimerase
MERVLITGAGGFIGGRLVEVLKETINPEVSILLRNIAKGARISRYPLHYHKGSIMDEEAVKAAMQDCDVVVHCAHDFANPEANLKAVDTIAKQCLQNKVNRLIYISSFAVHRADAGKKIDEQSTLNEQWDYAVNKIAVERKLIDYYHQSDLPVVILRPTIVYGPFSTAWTTSTVMQMLENRVVVPFEGQRICNAVYIDDVVGSIVKAINSPARYNGKSFIVSGPQAITWKQYYDSFVAYPDLHAPVYISASESEELYRKLNSSEPETRVSPVKDPITFLKKTPVYSLYQRLLRNPVLKKRLLSAKTAMPRPILYPSRDAFAILACTGETDITRLKNELGFQPKVFFAEGMEKTMAWMKWANLNITS